MGSPGPEPPKLGVMKRPLLLLLLVAMLTGATARTAEAQVESRKSPWVALGLSFVILGGDRPITGSGPRAA